MVETGPVQLDEPEFPPLLTGRRVVKGTSPVAEAVTAAISGELGAGDVLWSDDPDRVDLAIVLEPDVAFERAIQILPLAMAAVGDCIGAKAPPQVGVMFRWPKTILVNGAEAGTVELVVPPCEPGTEPEWMVIAVSLRYRHDDTSIEPGALGANITSLAEEGCEELTTVELIESCARHFLTWLNLWQDDGYKPVHYNWLERIEGREEPAVIEGSGLDEPVSVTGFDEDGNLLFKAPDGQARALPLLDAVTIHGRGA